jgi:nicotinate-nucleotide pyrophosphorylase (carboxylating)
MPLPQLTTIKEQVLNALKEDIGEGDITAALIPGDEVVIAQIISREHGVLCGCEWANQAFLLLDESVTINWEVNDGDSVKPNQVLCTVRGNARHILTGERTALNFLQALSGTSTITRRYVDEVKESDVKILDTRKTIPGLRDAQKYAVTCGGGTNHRIGLYDGVLIKENHIAAAGSIHEAVAQAFHHAPKHIPIEIEVETIQDVREALAAGADILLLDNMDLETIEAAVQINNGQAKLEISGGVTQKGLKELAETGVDFISIGALTKRIEPLDLSLLII